VCVVYDVGNYFVVAAQHLNLLYPPGSLKDDVWNILIHRILVIPWYTSVTRKDLRTAADEHVKLLR
jgi:hypothetical protein